MSKKIILISEIISFPFDEGLKNMSYQLIENLNHKYNVHVVTNKGNNIKGFDVEKVSLNKLFINKKLMLILKKYFPEIILYIPEASCTFNSFIRAKILKLMHKRAKVVLLAAQRRKYLFSYNLLLNFLRPDLLLVLSRAHKLYLEKKGMKIEVLPPPVDKKRFYPVENNIKLILKRKYGIPIDKVIVLHVGHIKRNRNIQCLIDVQEISDIQVVIVGSTTTNAEEKIKHKLDDQGIIIINNYISNIQEIYQLSDIYVFPVLRQNAAIEMPLSVLEAMACNLPVVTTRFGGLIDYFKEDLGFKYFDSTVELVELIKVMDIKEVHNFKKLECFTWNYFANQVISACERL